MTAFHFLTFVETETARSERVTEVFKDFQDNLFTGITEVQESGAVLFAIIVRGKIATLYHLNSKAERIEPNHWLDHLGDDVDEIKIRSLSLRITDLRYFKILIEECSEKTVSINISPKELLLKLNNSSNSSITFGESEDLSFLCYVPGKNAAASRLITLTPESVKSGSLADLIEYLPQSMGDVRIYPIQPETQVSAWVEQQLHEIFVKATQKLLSVYSSMRERVYLNKILRALNFKAGANDWMIFVNARNIDDQEIFESPLKAASVYSELLGLIVKPFKAELGETIFEQTLSEITENCSDLEKKLLVSLLESVAD